MSIIGRLDKQVDDVIISPVSKRRQGEDAPPEQPKEEKPAVPIQTPPAGESSAKTDELPVWLL